jgi:hypothetical protein
MCWTNGKCNDARLNFPPELAFRHYGFQHHVHVLVHVHVNVHEVSIKISTSMHTLRNMFIYMNMNTNMAVSVKLLKSRAFWYLVSSIPE